MDLKRYRGWEAASASEIGAGPVAVSPGRAQVPFGVAAPRTRL